jgi:hypothetical protein
MNRLTVSVAALRSAAASRSLRALFAAALAGSALLSLALLGGVGSASSSSSAAQYKNAGCTNELLSGVYATRSHGTQSPTGGLTPVGDQTPRVSTGRLDFDGNGQATGVTYANPPGTTSPDGNATAIPVVLHYQVRPDCTGYARGALGGPAIAFVLIDVKAGVAGAFELSVNSPGQYLTGRGTRIFP